VTHLELRNMVRATMIPEVTDVTDTYITLMLNQGIQEVALADQWRWLEASDTITTVVDQANYTLPDDFSFGLALVNVTNHVTVPQIAPQTYFHMFGDDDDTSSNASHFTVFDGAIYLAPVPDTATTDKYSLYYYKTPTELSADGDEPEWKEAFHWLLVDYAAQKLYRREGMMEQSMFHMAEYNASLEEMRRWYRRTFEGTRPIFGDGVVGRADWYRNLPGFMW
jgi:hypothetical protein